MSFSEGVSSADERHGLCVVHAHAAEHFADLQSTHVRVWIAKRTSRVDVYETNGIRAERVGTVALDGTRELFCLDLSGTELQTVRPVGVINAASTESENGS